MAATCCRRAAVFTASPVSIRCRAPSARSTSTRISPGLDPDPQPERRPALRLQLAVEGGDLDLDGERRPDRPLRVVLVGDGHAEDGEDRVADELLEEPAVPLDLALGALEGPPEEDLDDLRVLPLGEGGGARDVGEERRRELPLLAPAGAVASGAPQEAQKRAASGASAAARPAGARHADVPGGPRVTPPTRWPSAGVSRPSGRSSSSWSKYSCTSVARSSSPYV